MTESRKERTTDRRHQVNKRLQSKTDLQANRRNNEGTEQRRWKSTKCLQTTPTTYKPLREKQLRQREYLSTRGNAHCLIRLAQNRRGHHILLTEARGGRVASKARHRSHGAIETARTRLAHTPESAMNTWERAVPAPTDLSTSGGTGGTGIRDAP